MIIKALYYTLLFGSYIYIIHVRSAQSLINTDDDALAHIIKKKRNQ